MQDVTTHHFTLVQGEAHNVAELVNRHVRAGHEVTIDGRVAKSVFGLAPASGWSNGSLSVDVEPRTRGARSGTAWAKVGDRVVIEVVR